MDKFFIPFVLLFFFSFRIFADDYQITEIKPIFNDSTLFFGDFHVRIVIKNNTNIKKTIPVVCLYSGLTKPGIYYKDEPQIIKQYLNVNLEPNKENEIIFSKGFRSFHPETLGELIVSIVGTGVIKSILLKTRFAPGGD
jgi:hypothetical protein